MLDIQITHHALERIKQRGIKKKHALALLRSATACYRSKDGERVVYTNGGLNFVVIEHRHFWRLLTVVKAEEWQLI